VVQLQLSVIWLLLLVLLVLLVLVLIWGVTWMAQVAACCC
jgi:hypothetical protein